MINYLVLDIENDSSKQFKRKVGTSLVGDKLVSLCLKNKDEMLLKYVYPDEVRELKITEDLLVGHHLAHDLQWFWHLDDLQDFFKRGGRIWDTSVVENILTAQQHKYPALREIAVDNYKCPVREKVMEKYWDQGINTSDIPKELVLEDNKNDVLDTEQVFLKQYAEVERLGLQSFIELQMDAVLATIEMSMNGMKINQKKLQENKAKLEEQLRLKSAALLEIVSRHWK